MALCWFSAMFIAVIVVSTVNILEGSLPTSAEQPVGDSLDKTIDVDSKIGDKVDTFVENLNKKIEKFKEEIDSYQSRHPDIDDIRKLSQRSKNKILPHIKESAKSYIKDKLHELINFVHGSSSQSNEESSSRDYVDSDNSSEERRHKKQRNDRNCQGRESDSNEKENSEHSSSSEETGSHKQFKSFILDIIAMIKDKTSNITEAVIEKYKLDKSRLHDLFDNLREALKSIHNNNDNDESTKSDDGHSNQHDSSKSEETVSDNKNESVDVNDELNEYDDTEDDDHQVLSKTVWDQFGEDIQKLHASKQAFFDAKEEMIEAARKLHRSSSSSSTEDKDSQDRTEENTFNFESLITLKSKLHEMLHKKKQYIQEKIQLHRKIKDLLSSPFPTRTSTLSSSSAPTSTSTRSTTSTSTRSRWPFPTRSRSRTSTSVPTSSSTRSRWPFPTRSRSRTSTSVPTSSSTRSRWPFPTRFRTRSNSNENRNSLKKVRNNFPNFSADTHKEDTVTTAENVILSIKNENVSDTDDEVQQNNTNQDTSNSDQVEVGQTTDLNDFPWNISANRDGLKLAANYKGVEGDDDDDDDDDNTTVILLTVTACMVVSAAVCAIIVVVWRKHRRHRLYVRLPNGQTAPPLEEQRYSTW